ncbi:MAG: histone deacetylase family protein [Gammaproteobacteria bacterium]|nr:histone deacetylase family protein [Gammaproteobacteria bacterium]
MFRIRCIHDTLLPVNKRAIEQVQQIIQQQFSDITDSKIREIPEKLLNPMKFDFRSVLFVCDDRKGQVKGFALFSAEPTLRFGFLDLIALSSNTKGSGVGAALYQRIQEECVSLGFDWLFFECMSDLPEDSPDNNILKENRARMRFYERMGARPVVGTLYQRPRKANYDNAYFLMADDLDSGHPLDKNRTRKVVQAILRRKYKKTMADKHINEVVNSFTDDPVQLRPYSYIKNRKPHVYPSIPRDKKIVLCVTDGHAIHHIKNHDYAEQPVRVSAILDELEKTDMFDRMPRKHFSDKYILAVHDKRFVNYFKEVALSIDSDTPLFPDVFPIRKNVGTPKNIPSHAGYYCIDIYSPIYRNAYLAAREAVDATLTAAKSIADGSQFAYALVRPPGHHASHDSFGGYCYFNSTAIAAQFLSIYSKVAILDLDYHHGNGQEDIFYQRDDVLTISIHADPTFEYPYFSGYKEDVGDKVGSGYNLNIPLKKGIGGAEHLRAINRAIKKIRSFKPDVLVIALGLDTAQNDPSGSWNLVADDFHNNGLVLGGLRYPTLIVQEGGYDCSVLGKNALAFLSGLWNGFYKH